MSATAPPKARSGRPRGHCFAAEELASLRGAFGLDAKDADPLLEHLARPCPRCWEALDALPPICEPPSEPTASFHPPLSACARGSTHPLQRALHLLGGWRPRSWLTPAVRLALDAVREPLGIARLALEEAWHLSSERGRGEQEQMAWILAEWVATVERLAVEPDRRQQHRAVVCRGLAYLAMHPAKRGDRVAVEDLLERARRHLPKGAARGDLEGLLLRASAHAVAVEKPSLAEARLELAANLLGKPAHRLHRLVAQLDLVEIQLKRGDLRRARGVLRLAERGAQVADGPWLHQRLALARLAWRLGQARASGPGLDRVRHVVEALGLWEGLAPLPGSADRRLAERSSDLLRQTHKLARDSKPDPSKADFLELPVTQAAGLHLMQLDRLSRARGDTTKAVAHHERCLSRLVHDHQDVRAYLGARRLALAELRDRHQAVDEVRRMLDPLLDAFARHLPGLGAEMRSNAR